MGNSRYFVKSVVVISGTLPKGLLKKEKCVEGPPPLRLVTPPFNISDENLKTSRGGGGIQPPHPYEYLFAISMQRPINHFIT